MTAHDWFVEHRLDYAARALEPREEALFRDHLTRCAECREALAAIEHDLAWLPAGVDPVAPRPGFTRRVVEEIAGSARWSRRIWPAVAAAALLLAAVGAFRSRQVIDGLERELASSGRALLATRDTLGVVLRSDRVVQTAVEVGGRRGGLMIFEDQTTHRWKVVVHGIPAAPAGRRYSFWFITGDGMVHGREIVVDERRPAIFILDMPPGARLIKGCAITLEPRDGDPRTPRGPELAHLEL
ncbi:MAG: anti-sigma factor domain-containing protein [Gemmatimonadales bacterium]